MPVEPRSPTSVNRPVISYERGIVSETRWAERAKVPLHTPAKNFQDIRARHIGAPTLTDQWAVM